MARKANVLLCFSGSVATIKVPRIYNDLIKFSNVKLLSSGDAANHFLLRSESYDSNEWNKFVLNNGLDSIYSDKDEWRMWNKLSDPVLHIELRKWTDILLLCPASADIIAKISHGVADNLLLSVFRAWDFRKPMLVCPAMNTLMWDHPITACTLNTLLSWGVHIIPPVVKLLACNESGNGALANVEDIIEKVKKLTHLENENDVMLPDPIGIS